MQHIGNLYLSKQTPVPAESGTGKFFLSMLAYDRLGTHHVTPWRLIWGGIQAQSFWIAHRQHLTPGAVLSVKLKNAMLMDGRGRGQGPEVVAHVETLTLPAASI